MSSTFQRFTNENRFERVIEMTGPVLYHNIQNRALFTFSTFFNGIASVPSANCGYLTDGGFSGLAVVGWFPVAEFPYYYDIIRNERPIQVRYEFRVSGATSGYLRLVGLGTSTEPTGEGPSDSDEQISLALGQHLLAIQRPIPMPTAKDIPRPDK